MIIRFEGIRPNRELKRLSLAASISASSTVSHSPAFLAAHGAIAICTCPARSHEKAFIFVSEAESRQGEILDYANGAKVGTFHAIHRSEPQTGGRSCMCADTEGYVYAYDLNMGLQIYDARSLF